MAVKRVKKPMKKKAATTGAKLGQAIPLHGALWETMVPTSPSNRAQLALCGRHAQPYALLQGF